MLANDKLKVGGWC